jgi:hypothetical protein
MNLYHPDKKPVTVSKSDIIVFVVLLLEAKQIHASAANKKFVSSAKNISSLSSGRCIFI